MITKNVSEPWFSLIAAGKKSVEGRLNKGDFAELKKDDVITWTNDQLGFIRKVKTVVVKVNKYTSFYEYLTKEKLNHCLPTHGVDTISKGVKVYRQFYDKSMEKEFGIAAIKLRVSHT